MNRRRSLVSAVLAAALMLGQWLAAGHDTDHGLQSGAAHSCAVCAYASGAGTGALPAFITPVFEAARPAQAPAAADAARTAARRHHPIRGPPTFLS